MIIRKFTEQDAQAVSELIVTTIRISNTKDYPADLMEELVKTETPEHVLQRASWTHFYVAEEAGKIIGCGAIGPYWGKEDESSLFTIFVLPEWQGKGVGKAIVETLEKDEYGLRANRIEIPASITGLPFYRKLGYGFKDGIDTVDEEHLYRLEKHIDPPVIRQVEDPEEKSRIAREILEALPDWFGVPESREEYIRECRKWYFVAAERNGRAAGFLCLKETGKATVELAVTGVLKALHRRGTGRALFETAKEYAVNAGYEFMQVKTVAEGCYEDYDRTNRFYQGLGFRELEVIPQVWDEANPCQIYVMSLKKEPSLREEILNRRSYRGKYKPDKVPRKDLETILEAGLAAPSGCNKQTTSLVAVDDPEILKEINAVIDPPVCETAPAMICVLSQRINAFRDRCFATQDYSAAIENMLLTISSLGYGSCWFEGHITDEDRICDRIAEILNVPEGYDLVCILPVGRRTDEPTVPKKKPFEERAWFNGFGKKEETE